MVNAVSIDHLLMQDPAAYLLCDVRSPSEFSQGHIPDAHNLALFSDFERAAIGTVYKNISPEEALHLGFELVGPKLQNILQEAKDVSEGKPIVLHCWRGGKRSASVAWLLDFAGLNVSVLTGGYKAYRRFQRKWLSESPFQLLMLGGKTGSGKTEILRELQKRGEQVLDLEALAHHKGSAFGWIGEKDQPTSEQFENEVFRILRSLDVSKRIWVEDESRTLGKVYVPEPLWQHMKYAPLIHIDVPVEARVQKLVQMYAETTSHQDLIISFEKISKRLGWQHYKAAIEAVEARDYQSAAQIALVYYDKAYYYGLEQKKASLVKNIDLSNFTLDQIVTKLIEQAELINSFAISLQ